MARIPNSFYPATAKLAFSLSANTSYVNKRRILERFQKQLADCAVPRRSWQKVGSLMSDSESPR